MTYFLLEYEVRFPQKVYIWILEHYFHLVLLTAINRQSKVIHLAFLHSKIFVHFILQHSILTFDALLLQCEAWYQSQLIF